VRAKLVKARLIALEGHQKELKGEELLDNLLYALTFV
jgi:hypothetical protein